MSPQQAWEIVDNICAQVALNRADRQQVDVALVILRPRPETPSQNLPQTENKDEPSENGSDKTEE